MLGKQFGLDALGLTRKRGGALESLLSKFPGGTGVAFTRWITGGTLTNYRLAQGIGSNLFFDLRLTALSLAIGGEFMRINSVYIRELYKGFNDDTTPAVTKSGTWSSILNATTYPGKKAIYTNIAGRYLEFTTADGCTKVGALFGSGGSNTGVGLVSIDGDNTRATLLPTAQDLVTAGTLPDTVLVANGGTLNPTDRVINTYNLSANYPGPYVAHYAVFADDLTAGEHTIRITVTGYKQAASSSAYVLVNMLIAAGGYAVNDGAGYIVGLPKENVYSSAYPTWEISYNTQPSGASAPEWIGHTGSLKFIEVPTMTIDGESVAISGDQQEEVGSTIALSMQFGMRHSEIGGGATNIGTMDITYSMNQSTGLTISHAVVWSTEGTITRGYPCMFTVDDPLFDRFATLGNDPVQLTADDDSWHVNTDQQVAYAWDFDGYVAGLFYIPDLPVTVNNWVGADPNYKLAWVDISTPGWKKSYAVRYWASYNYSNAETWTSEAQYRVNYFQDGANNSLG